MTLIDGLKSIGQGWTNRFTIDIDRGCDLSGLIVDS